MEYNKTITLKEILNNRHSFHNKRGMNLENDINISNKHYIDTKQAFIYKKPTPIKIIKVDYPTKTNKTGNIVIKEAYFESPSTTDYNGLYQGKYIDFEAKETNNKNYFPLENIHPHQIKHIRNIMENGGISFLIVRFTEYNKTFLLFANDFFKYIDNTSRKSITYEYFLETGYEIKEKYAPRLDYLEVVKNHIDKYVEVNNDAKKEIKKEKEKI